MLLLGNRYLISNLKSQLLTQFEMKDLGTTRYILGMEIIRDRSNKKLWLSQSKYMNSMLERFDMTTCRSILVPSKVGDMASIPYASAVGSFMYAMVCTTRPKISQAVGTFS